MWVQHVPQRRWGSGRAGVWHRLHVDGWHMCVACSLCLLRAPPRHDTTCSSKRPSFGQATFLVAPLSRTGVCVCVRLCCTVDGGVLGRARVRAMLARRYHHHRCGRGRFAVHGSRPGAGRGIDCFRRYPVRVACRGWWPRAEVSRQLLPSHPSAWQWWLRRWRWRVWVV